MNNHQTYVADAHTNHLYSSKNNYRMCKVVGCNNPGHDISKTKHKLQGKILRRPLCKQHYYETLAVKKGMNPEDWRNSYQEYRYNMKNYCENVDGRLGFKCTTTIILYHGMLENDHKNGVPFDDNPANMQTLCSCCHKYKSNVFKDYATIGRKGLKGLSLSSNEKDEIIKEANIRYAKKFAAFNESNNIVVESRSDNNIKSDNSIEKFIASSKKTRKHNNKVMKYVTSYTDDVVKLKVGF